MTDDESAVHRLPSPVGRVVSIVPSLTEAIAETDRALLVGATDWCTHPRDLDVTRVRGTKNPDIMRIRELRPDLVVVNREENRREDYDALVAAGLNVHVTHPRTVGEAAEAGEFQHVVNPLVHLGVAKAF